MGLNFSEQSIEIAAPPQVVFDAITDYETFPAWQEAVEVVEVIDRDAAGRGRVVRFEVDAKFRRVGYTLRYSYEPPSAISWDFVSGEGVHAIEGGYSLEPAGEAGTRATYRLGIDPGVPVPGLLVRKLNDGVMRRSVEDLRDEAERRVR